MKPIQRVAVLLSGFMLGCAVVTVGGIIEAKPIPRDYFDYFGKEHAGIALLLEESVVYALPIFVLSLAWSAATLWRFRSEAGRAGAWCAAGLALTWIAAMSYLLDSSLAGVDLRQMPVGSYLASLMRSPWWTLPNHLAPWLGLGAAVWAVRRAAAKAGVAGGT